MDCFVLPTHREGLGTSLLEAASMSIPVLTTSHTGSRDAIRNKKNGFYVKSEAKDIAEKIEVYIKKPDLKIKHGKTGRVFIKNNFDQKIIWKEIETKLYK